MSKTHLKDLMLSKIDDQYVANVWKGLSRDITDTQQLGMEIITALNSARAITGQGEVIALQETDFEFQYLLTMQSLGRHTIRLRAHHQSEKVEGAVEIYLNENGTAALVSEMAEDIHAIMEEHANESEASEDQHLGSLAIEPNKDQIENLSKALASTQAKLNDLQSIHDDVMNRLTGRDLTIVVHGGSDEHNAVISNYIIKNVVDQMFIEEDGVRRLKPEVFETEDVTTGEDMRYVIGELILVHPHLKTVQLQELYLEVASAIAKTNILQSAITDLGLVSPTERDDHGFPLEDPKAKRLGRLCADVMSVTAYVLTEGLEVALIDNRDINREEVDNVN